MDVHEGLRSLSQCSIPVQENVQQHWTVKHGLLAKPHKKKEKMPRSSVGLHIGVRCVSSHPKKS